MVRQYSVPQTHSEWTTGADRYVPIPWVPDFRRWWVYDGIHTRLNRGQAIGASVQKIWKSHCIPISTKVRLMKALVWPVATCSCESWTLRKNEETRLVAFEMKGLRMDFIRVSWTAKKTNELVLNKAGVKRELLDTVKGRKLGYYGHTMTKQGERDNARNNARCTQARKTTHGLDGQHQDIARTSCGRVSQNDRGQR